MFTPIANRIPWLSRMDCHMKEVVQGMSIAFVLKVLGAMLGFGFSVLLARLLGAKQTGIYYLALTVATIGTVLGRLGLDNALLRFTAVNATQGAWDKVAGIYHKSMWIATISSSVTTLLIISLAPWIAQGIFSKPMLTNPLRLMALGIISTCLFTLHSQLLKGLKKIRDAMLVESIGMPLISLPLLVLLIKPLGILGAVMAHVIATIFLVFLSVWLWRLATPQLRNLHGDFDTRLLMSTSLPLFLVASMNLVMAWTDTIMLGIWVDSKSVGIYSVAMRTSLLTCFILSSVNCILAPKFASLYAQGNYQALGDLARNAAKLATILAMPILSLLIIIPEQILGLFGSEFIAGKIALSTLAIGQFINVSTGSVGYLLMMSGYEKLMRNNIIASAALNIILNAILIPKYNIVGAAIATAISVATMNLISASLVYWKLSIITLPIPGGFWPQ